MKNEKLYNSITNIREDIIEKSDNYRFKNHHKTAFITSLIAAMLVIAIIGGGIIYKNTIPISIINEEPTNNMETTQPASSIKETSTVTEKDLPKYEIATPQYPIMADYPSNGSQIEYEVWFEDVQKQRRNLYFKDDLNDFFISSTKEFLSDSKDKNRVYSPLNVYMALSMLAELTDGNSRQQILDLLNCENIATVRKQSSDIWNSNYRDDGASSCVLASSLWLNENIRYVQSTMDILAENYYASSYQGEMGSQGLNDALHNWLNTQTGDLLQEQVKDIKLTPDIIMGLATTVLFKSNWTDKFDEKKNTKDVFYSSSGNVDCTYMNNSGVQSFYYGDNFTSICKYMELGSMWFILPDENLSAQELIYDEQVMDFILKGEEWENQKNLTVNETIPKFDVVSDIDLSQGLKNMGVTDVFDYTVSDFSPTTTDIREINITQATHSARVIIDEEGCVATAFTVMLAAGGAIAPEDEIDFVLNRPFIFVIKGESNLPLFIGIVNNPQ